MRVLLLTKADRRALPPLGANEELGLAALARVKFFTPASSWTWYASEFDGDDLFFGLVDAGLTPRPMGGRGVFGFGCLLWVWAGAGRGAPTHPGELWKSRRVMRNRGQEEAVPEGTAR